jgi:hypothetical protein
MLSLLDVVTNCESAYPNVYLAFARARSAIHGQSKIALVRTRCLSLSHKPIQFQPSHDSYFNYNSESDSLPATFGIRCPTTTQTDHDRNILHSPSVDSRSFQSSSLFLSLLTGQCNFDGDYFISEIMQSLIDQIFHREGHFPLRSL